MSATKTLATAALAGLLTVGFTSAAIAQNDTAPVKTEKTTKNDTSSDKHSCKAQNSCKGKGGCKTGDNGCAGKNSCKGKGGCSTMTKKDDK